MAWTSPRTWVAGAKLNAAHLNTDVRDNLNFIDGRTLGYAEVTSDQGSITSETDLTGLTLTLTPASGRRIRISGYGEVSINDANSRAVMSIHRDGTQVNRAVSYHPVGSAAAGEMYQPVAVIEEDGSQHTYKLRLARTVGSASATLEATATSPAFILVEDIGAA